MVNLNLNKVKFYNPNMLVNMIKDNILIKLSRFISK
jgi:hypothetical protein